MDTFLATRPPCIQCSALKTGLFPLHVRPAWEGLWVVRDVDAPVVEVGALGIDLLQRLYHDTYRPIV